MDDSKNNIYARWLAGDISEVEMDALRQSGELSELESILAATDALTLVPYDQDRAYQRIVNNRKPNTRESIIPLMANKWAALAAVLVGVLSYFLLSQNASEIIKHEAPIGAMVTIPLPDESTIILNDGSMISYDMTSYEEQRTIDLKGEASFDVESGSPFRVETTGGTVEVLGTQFNVRTWDGAFVVECYEGSVRVTAPRSSLVLRPQESAVLRSDGQLELRAIDHTQPYWQVGISRFDSASVQDVFEEFMRQYDVEIIYQGRNKIFNGAFTHDSLETALREICRPLDLSYQIDPNKKRIVIQ